MVSFNQESIPAPVRTILRHRLLTPLRRAFVGLLDSCPILSCAYAGFTFYYPKSSSIGFEIARGQGWNANLKGILECLFGDPAPVIAEVGSNIGASLMQMMLARPGAFFYCFEPSTRFLPFLKKNIRCNGWRNVKLEPLLLASEAGTRRLFNNASTASVVKQEYDGHRFFYAEDRPATTLDDYFASCDRLDMIKIDTDGYDFDVLLGGRRLLERLHPVLYFELSAALLEASGHTATELMEYLRALGYRKYLPFSPAGQALALEEDIAGVVDLAGRQAYFDVLTVHAGNGEQEQLLSALLPAGADHTA